MPERTVVALWLLFAFAAAGSPAAQVAARVTPDYVGTWVSETDGSLLELTSDRYHLRFETEEGRREIFGTIVRRDHTRRWLTIRYDKVLQAGREKPEDLATVFLSYRVENGRLRKRIGRERFPEAVDDETFVRRPPPAPPD